jgi:hypothetical protein
MTGVCRRRECGHTDDAHRHYGARTDCSGCECPHYLGQAQPRRTLAAAGCSLAAAALAGGAWWRLAGGYHGAALVWLGLGSITMVIIGANVADSGRGIDDH